MEILRKELHPAEIKRRCVCVPKEKQPLFPKVGEKLDVKDNETASVHTVTVLSQYRLGMPSFYDEHKGIQAGDTIVFQLDNGGMSVSIEAKTTSKSVNPFERRPGKLSIFEGKVLDLIITALANIEDGGIEARVTVGDTGITVEWGDHIKSTEIILRGSKVTA